MIPDLTPSVVIKKLPEKGAFSILNFKIETFSIRTLQDLN